MGSSGIINFILVLEIKSVKASARTSKRLNIYLIKTLKPTKGNIPQLISWSFYNLNPGLKKGCVEEKYGPSLLINNKENVNKSNQEK